MLEIYRQGGLSPSLNEDDPQPNASLPEPCRRHTGLLTQLDIAIACTLLNPVDATTGGLRLRAFGVPLRFESIPTVTQYDLCPAGHTDSIESDGIMLKNEKIPVKKVRSVEDWPDLADNCSNTFPV